MPLILPGNVASATADAGFNVDNSCRFDGTSSCMEKDQGTATDTDKFTMSFWIKKCSNGAYRNVMQGMGGGTDYTTCTFNSSDQMDFGNRQGGHVGRLVTTRVFRDPAAWYHFVCVWDSGNATAGNRMRMYVNGVEETAFATDTNPAEDETPATASGDKIHVGAHNASGYFWDGYMAEVYFCDGQAYAASDFGEFDEDSPTIWKPKDASGDLTFGNNGFYLDFKASDNLGNDANGGTDLAETGLDAADQATDSPTNNFCTMNPLDDYFQSSDFAEGNCKITTDNGTYNTSTFGLSSGKWYMECEMDYDAGVGDYWRIGIVDRPSTGVNVQFGAHPNSYAADQGSVIQSGTNSTFGAPFVDGDIISIALDLDNNTIAWAKDGAYGGGVGSGTWSGSLSATHSITAPASTLNGHYFIAGGANDETSGGYRMLYNFGGCSPFDVSSGNADENGYGNFEFAVPSGYLAICTKNLGSDGG